MLILSLLVVGYMFATAIQFYVIFRQQKFIDHLERKVRDQKQDIDNLFLGGNQIHGNEKNLNPYRATFKHGLQKS